MQRLRLNIGCGLITPSGWINIDSSWNARFAKCPWFKRILVSLHIISPDQARIPWPRNIHIHDVREGLSFRDNSAEVIYSSHLLEHLARKDALFFLEQCYRVLAPGGIIRIIVPDLEHFAKQYMERLRQGTKELLIKEPPSDKFLEDLWLYEKGSTGENILIRLYKKIYNKNTHKWMYDQYSLTSCLVKCGFENVQRKECYDSLIEDVERLDSPEGFKGTLCLEAQKL